MTSAADPGFPPEFPSIVEEPPVEGLVLNSTIETQLAHRTIRAFTDEPVAEDVMATLLDVARHTASSGFYQGLTILRIKDPQIRQRIYRSSGQPYVGAPQGELLVFVVDLSKTARVREAAGADLEPLGRTGAFLQGADDAVLAAQNVVVAAESLGLGTCLLGSIRTDPEDLIDAMKLPKYTFPLLGILIGHPNQNPQMKPRLPREITISVDTYPDFESAQYKQAWADYDQVIQEYYDLREGGKRQDTYTDQLIRKPGNPASEKADMLGALHAQGLCTH
ncbi:NADPH-dependent oxidoreductase [Actinomycetaceae bacterium MB13-C1-2]|nr:NADPH-dependent oxidoreductase [Actinomycetaceae bacterium MB13-C1-2]